MLIYVFQMKEVLHRQPVIPINDEILNADYKPEPVKPAHIPCQRVSVIHYHSSSTSDESLSSQQDSTKTPDDSPKRLTPTSPDKEENSNPTSPSFIKHEMDLDDQCSPETSGHTNLSVHNEPFVPDDDRAIGNYLIACPPELPCLSLKKKLLKSAKQSIENYNSISRKWESRRSSEKTGHFKIALLEEEALRNLSKNQHNASDIQQSYSSPPEPSSITTSSYVHSNCSSDDNGEGTDGWEIKARYVNIAPKVGQQPGNKGIFLAVQTNYYKTQSSLPSHR